MSRSLCRFLPVFEGRRRIQRVYVVFCVFLSRARGAGGCAGGARGGSGRRCVKGVLAFFCGVFYEEEERLSLQLS